MHSRRLVAVDPGKCAGVALYEDAKLVHATVAEGNWSDSTDIIERILFKHKFIGPRIRKRFDMIVEVPVMRGNGGKVENDLIPLILMAGALWGQLSKTRMGQFIRVKPEDWKGRKDKLVMVEHRIIPRLTESEKAKVDPKIDKLKTKRHNMYDAVGIGLHRLGRLKRKY